MILHVLVGKTHRENSTSKLDNDAKRVANMYMDITCVGDCHQQYRCYFFYHSENMYWVTQNVKINFKEFLTLTTPLYIPLEVSTCT